MVANGKLRSSGICPFKRWKWLNCKGYHYKTIKYSWDSIRTEFDNIKLLGYLPKNGEVFFYEGCKSCSEKEWR